MEGSPSLHTEHGGVWVQLAHEHSVRCGLGVAHDDRRNHIPLGEPTARKTRTAPAP